MMISAKVVFNGEKDGMTSTNVWSKAIRLAPIRIFNFQPMVT